MLNSFIIVCILSTAICAEAASTDFDGNGRSDASAVEAASPLKWYSVIDNQTVQITAAFGDLGVHLAAGSYSGGAQSEPAFITSDGTWHVLQAGNDLSFTLAVEDGTYLAGADIDGDGKDDALVHTARCERKTVVLRAMINPLSASASTVELRGGKGRFFSTYGDANGDGKDDFCWLNPVRRGGELSARFSMRCRDVTGRKRIKRFSVGKVYERPLPLSTGAGKPDNFAFPRIVGSQTQVLVRNTRGRRVKSLTFSGTGTLLIGNYTNSGSEPEQLAMAGETSLNVYDFSTGTTTEISAPSGIKFDEININHFNAELDNCICTSENIVDGKCTARKGDDDPGNPEGPCQVTRDIADGSGGFLHKPVSDTTGSIVNLFARSDDPASCRYENSAGELLSEAIFTGYGNPDRAHFRPASGARCGSFPEPLVVACIVQGQENCWTVPDPCLRYD